MDIYLRDDNGNYIECGRIITEIPQINSTVYVGEYRYTVVDVEYNYDSNFVNVDLELK